MAFWSSDMWQLLFLLLNEASWQHLFAK
jgi:hypothetical protein